MERDTWCWKLHINSFSCWNKQEKRKEKSVPYLADAQQGRKPTALKQLRRQRGFLIEFCFIYYPRDQVDFVEILISWQQQTHMCSSVWRVFFMPCGSPLPLQNRMQTISWDCLEIRMSILFPRKQWCHSCFWVIHPETTWWKREQLFGCGST